MKLTKDEIVKTSKKKLDYNKAGMFLHCKHCLGEYLKARDKTGGVSEASPRDTFNYEISSYPFAYPNGTNANILAIWCKKCGRVVWDSRHLQPLF